MSNERNWVSRVSLSPQFPNKYKFILSSHLCIFYTQGSTFTYIGDWGLGTMESSSVSDEHIMHLLYFIIYYKPQDPK